MNNDIFDYLSKLQLDHIISHDLLSFANISHFKDGEYLCNSGEEVQKLHIVLNGLCKVFSTSAEGKFVLVSHLYPGDFCGDIEIFNDCLYLQNVQAFRDVITLVITREDLFKYFFKNIDFLQFLCRRFAGKSYLSSYHYSHALLYPLKVRLAQYLVYETDVNNTNILQLKVEEMAQYFGTSSRHIRRILSELKQNELIARNNTIETYVNISKLKIYLDEIVK